jgi:hypothetical protein
MLSKQAQFPIASYLSKSLETLCDLRVMLSHGQGLGLPREKRDALLISRLEPSLTLAKMNKHET